MLQEDDIAEQKVVRGRGRGSSFFALEPVVLERAFAAPTDNRLNLVTTYLVLLAGTGADHRLTKWSARACEEYTGMAKPRAKQAIEELVAARMIERTEQSTRMFPQYRLPALDRNANPIFLPVQLVTGLGTETPILRRVRETGDPMILRMLLDLYAQVQVDAAYAPPLARIQLIPDEDKGARQVMESGVHALWALNYGSTTSVSGDWFTLHKVKPKKAGEKGSEQFWERMRTLQKIGAIWFEPWVFSSKADDADPMMPIDLAPYYGGPEADATTILTRTIAKASMLLTQDRPYLLANDTSDLLLPMPLHHQAPAFKGVAKLRVEPDTPGRRLAYAKRMELIENCTAAYEQLAADIAAERFDRPLKFHRTRENV